LLPQCVVLIDSFPEQLVEFIVGLMGCLSASARHLHIAPTSPRLADYWWTIPRAPRAN